MKKITITLRKLNPEAAEMWCYDLNGELTPDSVSGHSDIEVYFRCLKNSKHLFTKKISKMTAENGRSYGCVYCGPNAKKVFPGETDFLTKCHEARSMWDYELNKDIDPTNIFPGSMKYAFFKCEKGHIIYRKIFDFFNSPKCGECEKEKTKLIYQFPYTKKFWDMNKNHDINLDEIIQSSRDIAYFKCPNCKYEWKSQISLWNKRRYCPCCGFDGSHGSVQRNRSIIEQNPIITFRMANPEDAGMWSYDLNRDMTPDSVLYMSNKKAYFKCLNGHEFSREISTMTTSDGKSKGCPHCKQTIRIAYSGENDFFTMCPTAKEMWDYDKNAGVDPESLLAGSGVKVYFKCYQGHSFIRKIYQFNAYPRCPECEFIEKYSLAVTKPEMLKFWDYEKNTISPYIVSPYSKDKVYWRCQKCDYSWRAVVANRSTATKNKCPSCDMGRDFNKGQNNAKTFKRFNPGASKLWVDELNEGLTPDTVSERSGKTVYLRCLNNPEHIYTRKVYTIPKQNPFGCPYCKDEMKIAALEGNNIFEVCPESKEMWDWEKNKGINPYHLFPRSSTRIHLKCIKGHEFERTVYNFVRTPKCPKCKRSKYTIANYSHMVNQWDFEKNETIDINNTSASSIETAWWKCIKCGYEWQSQISSRKASKGLCPCCENRTVVVKGITDLFTVAPNLKIDYNLKKNIGIDITTLSATTNKLIWWKCHTCSYEWQASPNGRLKYKSGNYIVRNCPACAGVVRTKTYAEEHPELMERFIEDKNKCKFNDLIKGENYRRHFWWYCDICGEEFKATLGSMIRSKNSEYKGCPYCSGKKVKRDNSFADLHPEVMDEFAQDNTIDPYCVTENSDKIANWICRNNIGHKWSASFKSRAKGEGGCNICRGWRYDKIFSDEHPEFEPFYNIQKNKRPFNTYPNMSNEYAWWKCDKGHSFEWSIMNFSRLGRFECPICTNKIAVAGENDLESQYPDLAIDFDVEKNGITPDKVTFTYTNEDIWWKCSAGHEFKRSVWYRVNQVNECPVCSREIVVKGINDFQTVYPDITKIWDYELNGRGPDVISDRSNMKFSFKCKYGHRYETLLGTAVANNFECMVCKGKIVQAGYNSLVDTDFELSEEWSPTNERGPETYHKTNKIWIYWLCPTCGGEYGCDIDEREVGDNSCPYCHKGRALEGYNSLVDTDFELSKEWGPTNERAPETYHKKHKSWVYWLCPTCKGEYTYPIDEREVGDDSCPYCHKGRALEGYNSLVDTNLELTKEWSPTNERGPETYSIANSTKVYWLCSTCKGEYRYPINEREVGDDSCPYCNKNRALEGYNSLVDADFELSKEWSPRNERGPETYTKTNTSWVSWLCPTCKGEYSYPINEREVGDDSCPYCHKGRALEGYNSLVDTNLELTKEWSPTNGRGPETYTKTNTSSVSWLCPTCKGEYGYSINEREVGDDSCPYCHKGRALEGYNSLVDTNFELSKEWSPTNERGPETYHKSNKRFVFWLCLTCGGEYNYPVSEREIDDDSCPYCKETRVLPGYNSFKIKHPNLMEEWDYINNYLLCDANYILDNSINKVWWNCMDCNHKYYMSPKQRVYYQKRRMKSCPYCKGLRQKRRHFF